MADRNTHTGDIEVHLADVHKTYRMGEVTVPVLHGVDLDIVAGEITVVNGASGSGKSTLLNLIGGIDQATSGRIEFQGRDLSAMDDADLTEYRRGNIGFVFQFYNLVPTLTARENVEVSTEICADPMAPDRALELVDLADRMEHFPAQMSGGQQQRVAIARALAKNPRLMLCDEPTGALDAETGRMILKLLTRLNDELNATIVLITHAQPIARLAHRVVRLTSGRIVDSHRNEHRAAAEEIKW